MKLRMSQPIQFGFRPAWPALGVLALTLVAFLGVLGHDFVHFDDNINIYGNPHLERLDGNSLHWMFTDVSYARRYMPVGWLSYAIDRACFGLSPRAYHAGNLLLHLANSALLYVLLKALLSLGKTASSERDESMIRWCAAAGALFWSINPLRVETVAWASSRIYCVGFFFAMVWLLSWLWSREAECVASSRRRLFYSISVGAYVVSLLTYPMALFAPVLLFAVEVLPVSRRSFDLARWWSRGAWTLWRDKVPFLGLALVALVVTYLARSGGGVYNKPVAVGDFSVLERAMQAFYVWAYYVWKPWIPFDLAPIYTTLYSFEPLSWPFAASACAVLVISVLAIAFRKRFPGLALLWLCHVVILIPFLGLSEYNHSASDRYSYLPGILWSILIAFGFRAVAVYQSWRRMLIGAAALAVLLLSFGVVRQVPVWRDTFSLHEHLLAQLGEHPARSRFDEVIAVHYLRAGMTNESVAALRRAIVYENKRQDRQIVDEGVLARSHVLLGGILMDRQQLADSVVEYRAALQATPDDLAATVNLGSALAQMGHFGEACRYFERATELSPQNAGIRRALQSVREKVGHERVNARQVAEVNETRAE